MDKKGKFFNHHRFAEDRVLEEGTSHGEVYQGGCGGATVVGTGGERGGGADGGDSAAAGVLTDVAGDDLCAGTFMETEGVDGRSGADGRAGRRRSHAAGGGPAADACAGVVFRTLFSGVGEDRGGFVLLIGSVAGAVHQCDGARQFDVHLARQLAGSVPRLWRVLRHEFRRAETANGTGPAERGIVAHRNRARQKSRCRDGSSTRSSWAGIAADQRPGLFQRAGVCRHDGRRGTLFVAPAVWHGGCCFPRVHRWSCCRGWNNSPGRSSISRSNWDRRIVCRVACWPGASRPNRRLVAARSCAKMSNANGAGSPVPHGWRGATGRSW